MSTDVQDWTVTDVCTWAEQIGLGGLVMNIRSNRISGKELLRLNQDGLEEVSS